MSGKRGGSHYERLDDEGDEPTGKIVYAVVARSQVVLSECSLSSGNFATITRVLLSKIAKETHDRELLEQGKVLRKSLTYDSYMFHYLIEGELMFMCLAENSLWHRAAFIFLDNVSDQFRTKFLPEHSGMALPETFTSVPLSLDREFKTILRQEVTNFNQNIEKDSKRSDMLEQVKSHIDDVKTIVVENIEKVLQRGEKIDLLVDKTDRMQQTAYKFESSARNLKNSMWWKNARKSLMLAGIACIVIFFISASACGGINFKDCR